MIPITKLRSLPPISGIYKVLDASGNVIYVGQATNLYKRWNNGHHMLDEIIAECGVEAYIDWVEVPDWLLNRTENTVVSFYQPMLNSKNPSVV